MQSNTCNKFIFFAIDKKYNINFIKSFVEFTSLFNNDDGFYLINSNFDFYSPAYVNALICKYPYKKNNLQYLLQDVVTAIKKTEDENNRYLIIITDDIVDEKIVKTVKKLNVKLLIKNTIDEEVMNFCFKELND